MEHRSPKPIRLVLTGTALAYILTLMLALSGATFQLDVSSANGNFPQRTDQEAGCNYGTQKLADWKIPEPGSFTSVQQGRGFGIDPSDPCFIFLYWTS
ncbi:MAG: hypothetical protein ACO39F_06220, partial [Candidatus Nanopelagicaceae bacterium]